MTDYRNLHIDEIDRSLFGHFIRHQIVTKCWRREQGKWVIRDAPFVDDWSEEDYRVLIEHLKNVLSGGGFVYAAFSQGYLKGFVSVEAQWLCGSKEVQSETCKGGTL